MKERHSPSSGSGGAAPTTAVADIDTEAPAEGSGGQETGGDEEGAEGKLFNKPEKVPEAKLTSSDSAPASEDSPWEDGEVKARPVSVANTTQCCGGLKSGVCTLL